MELVPFSEKWAGSETKLDLQAWYRRPCLEHGGFSLVGPLPLRRHLDWTRKGFEYVTVASLEDLALVAPMLRAAGLDVAAMAKSYDQRLPRGPFKVVDYLKDAKASDAAYLVDLQAKVDKFGAEAVTEMLRVNDPAFVIPESIVVAEPAKGGKK